MLHEPSKKTMRKSSGKRTVIKKRREEALIPSRCGDDDVRLFRKDDGLLNNVHSSYNHSAAHTNERAEGLQKEGKEVRTRKMEQVGE